MFAYSRLDAVLLERMAGAAHADVYASAFRLLDACNMFGYLFASLLLPMFARMLKDKTPVQPLVSLSFKLIWAGSITLAAAIFFAREDLLQLMMPERATEYRFTVLGILIWTFIPLSVTHIFSTLLTAKQDLMRMNRYFLMGVLLDLGLNILLIPYWNAAGSAIAALTTQAFIAGSMVWLCMKTFEFKPTRNGLLQTFGFAGFVLLGDLWLFEETGIDWKWKFSGALMMGGVGLLLFKMVEFSALMRLKKE
jgi:O-antigen/teichoic acid export membrane protein